MTDAVSVVLFCAGKSCASKHILLIFGDRVSDPGWLVAVGCGSSPFAAVHEESGKQRRHRWLDGGAVGDDTFWRRGGPLYLTRVKQAFDLPLLPSSPARACSLLLLLMKSAAGRSTTVREQQTKPHPSIQKYEPSAFFPRDIYVRCLSHYSYFTLVLVLLLQSYREWSMMDP